MWQNLRSRLLLLFLILLLIPIIGTGIYGHFFLSNTFLEKTIEVEQQNLSSQASNIGSIFTDIQNTLNFIADVRSIKVLANSVPDSDLYLSSLQVLQSDMQSMVSTHPMIEYLAFYNVIGEQILSIESMSENSRVDLDAVGSFVKDVLQAPAQTTHLMANNNRASANTDRITVALRTLEGVILISLRNESIFQSVSEQVITETWSLRLPIRVVLHYTANGQKVLSPALNQHDDWLRNTRGYYVDNKHHVFYQNLSIQTVQDQYTMTLFHTIPSTRLRADLSLYYQTFTLLAVGVLLCVIALALFAINRFVEPLVHLKLSVDHIRKTQQTPDLPKQLPPDEIGELTLSFYSMATELETKRQSERALVEKLIMAQEEERTRIAYDLHDGLIQQLVGARFYLNQCKATLCDVAPKHAVEIFTEGYESLSSAIIEGRRIMQGLHPSTLDDLGLVEALRELGNNIAKRSQWRIQLDLDDFDLEPDKAVSVSLYRITQEALNNASQHARATQVHVRLWHDNGIHLSVKDDGQGFDPKHPPESDNGWGLRTMKERVTLLDGVINITSQIGDGTMISIWIPEPQTLNIGVNDDHNSE